MCLTYCFYRFAARLHAIRLRAGKPNYIPLSVQTRNKHWAVMGIAMWLVKTHKRWLTTFRRHISQSFAEAAVTKLCRASEKFDGVISAEGRKARLHRPIVFIAERQNICAHGPSLASVPIPVLGLRTAARLLITLSPCNLARSCRVEQQKSTIAVPAQTGLAVS